MTERDHDDLNATDWLLDDRKSGLNRIIAMSTQTPPDTIVYPDRDEQPMSDNTLQFQWIVTIVGGLQALFRDRSDVFVAGDLLWYPVEGNNAIRTAPDAMVVFGRPKGYRGSYQQWREGDIPPQVVFEIVSPGNRAPEMTRKFRFYEHYGVEEYYLFEPELIGLAGWRRQGGGLEEIPEINGWQSPRLGTRFELAGGEFRIVRPDGLLFETYEDLHGRTERLAAQLRALGIEPEA